MSNVVFICSSSNIHKYLYLTIVSYLDHFVNAEVFILVDKNCKIEFPRFNKIISYIDHRFSNFRMDPLEIIDVSDNDKIKIINDISLINDCDWIVLQNRKFDYSKYENISKNGLLCLDFNYNSLKKDLFDTNILNLNICHKKPQEIDWRIFTKVLKSEKGIKNNTYKILFNYNVFFINYLKNYYNLEILEFNNYKQVSGNYKFAITNYYLKLLSNILFRKFLHRKLRWKIAFKQNKNYVFLKQPEKSFWADPFIIKNNNQNYIFFEELKPDGIGAISCLEYNKNFEIINKEIIIDKAFHLSFPNVFSRENDFFMIPESSANNSLDIYKCTNFPYEWHFHKILMDKIRLIDPVLFFHDNMYWIFANKIEDFEFDNNERLYLYYSNDLFSDNWTPHIQNPIITDSSCARNGGKIYQKDNKIYRVSQNCSNSYGKNLVVNEITNLTTNNYSERKDHEIFPHKKFKGMHTMNFIDDIQVFDFLDSKK